jgi:hypothetical protein
LEKPEPLPITPPAQPARPTAETRINLTDAEIESDAFGSGSLIEADEDFYWGASPLDAFESLLKLPVSNLTLIEDHPFYLHTLINRDGKEVVSATLLRD